MIRARSGLLATLLVCTACAGDSTGPRIEVTFTGSIELVDEPLAGAPVTGMVYAGACGVGTVLATAHTTTAADGSYSFSVTLEPGLEICVTVSVQLDSVTETVQRKPVVISGGQDRVDLGKGVIRVVIHRPNP